MLREYKLKKNIGYDKLHLENFTFGEKTKQKTMGFIHEFRKFALRGNVMDLAIGIVIGAAFGKIVSSLVDDIITPAILTPALTAAHLKDLNQLVIPGTAIKYGNFISQIIAFIIVALALFLIIQGINKTQKKAAAAANLTPPEPSSTDKLLMEIRDSLKDKSPQ